MKNILLAVTGLSPQVVTETIFALHKEKIQIDEIYIITTQKGKNQAWLGLGVGQSGKGQLASLIQDYDLPEIIFSESSIHIVPDANGNLVDDARTVSDQYALADFITNTVRELTQNNETRLFASLAGGRKTMTFFLGYAMSLFGREQDKLSHVLVDADYENIPDFFYPTPYDKTIRNNSGLAFNAKSANVQLIDIPYVRMRDELPSSIIEEGEGYIRTIEKMNLANEPLSLEINYQQNTITASGIEIEMAEAEFIFYSWFVENKINNKEGFQCPIKEYPDKSYAQQYIGHYKAHGKYESESNVAKSLREGMTTNYFSERKSRVGTVINEALGKKLGAHYVIQKSKNDKGVYLHFLDLQNDDIHISRSSHLLEAKAGINKRKALSTKI